MLELFEMSPIWALAVDLAGWSIIQAGSSFLFFRIPARWLDVSRRTGGGKLEKTFEEKFYLMKLRIRKWKDLLQHAQSLLDCSFAESKLSARDAGCREKYMLDTRRGEWVHWMSIASSALFFLWNEVLYGWMIVIYALAANLPVIVILRYNRLRMQRIVRKSGDKKWAAVHPINPV